MKIIKILHLVSKSGDNYIVEGKFRDTITTYHWFSGYVVDSSDKLMPTGEKFCFSIIEEPSTNLLNDSSKYITQYNIIDSEEIIFYNWYQKLYRKVMFNENNI